MRGRPDPSIMTSGEFPLPSADNDVVDQFELLVQVVEHVATFTTLFVTSSYATKTVPPWANADVRRPTLGTAASRRASAHVADAPVPRSPQLESQYAMYNSPVVPSVVVR